MKNSGITSFIEDSIIVNTQTVNFTTLAFNIADVRDIVFQIVQKTGDISSAQFTMEQSLDNIGWFSLPNPKTGAGLSAVFKDIVCKFIRFKITIASAGVATAEIIINGKR